VQGVAADEKCKVGSGKAWKEALTRNSFCSENMAGNLAPIQVEIAVSTQNVIHGKGQLARNSC
jgi:hypothetical protein